MMNKSATMDSSNSTTNQTKIQNFPDYLRYVMMKSMAGFGKVHTELTRLYTGVNDRPMSTAAQFSESNENLQEKKRGFRQRWSMRDNARPPAGTLKQSMFGETFTSYIEEEDSDVESNLKITEALLDSDILKGDKTDFMSEKLPSSAPPLRCRKAKFTFDERSESMPHSELMNEATYVNDRVVYVDQEDTCQNNNDELCEAIEKENVTLGELSESDDYVDMTNTDIGTSEKIKDDTVRSENLYQSLTQKIKKPEASDGNGNKNKPRDQAEDSDSEEPDYDDPTAWTHDYVNVTDKKGSTVATSMMSGKVTSTNVYKQGTYATNDTSDSKTNKPSGDKVQVNVEDSDYDILPVGVNPIATKGIDYSKSGISSNDKSMANYKESDYDVLPAGIHPISATSKPNKSQGVKGNVNDEESDYDVLPAGIHPKAATFKPNKSQGVKGNVNDERSDYDVPTIGINHKATNSKQNKFSVDKAKMNDEECDYDIPPVGVHPITVPNLMIDGHCGEVLNSNTEKPNIISKNKPVVEYSDYDIPKSPRKFLEKSTENTTTGHDIGNTTRQPVPDSKEARTPIESTKPICEYNVEETVHILVECSLNKLADICLTRQIDGAYLSKLDEKDLMAEPYSMNWFHVSRLKKVLRGWRPKVNKHIQNQKT